MSEVRNKIRFTIEKDSKKVELCVERPSFRQQDDSQKVYAAAFAEYLQAGAILKEKLDSHIRAQNLWDDAKQQRLEELTRRLNENEKKVKGQVKGTTLKEARNAAIAMQFDRRSLRDLLLIRSNIEANTAQGQAENRRFHWLVANCLKYNDSGESYFKSYEDYRDHQDDPAVAPAITHFADLYYGQDPDYEKNLPENQFLLRYKMVNDKLQLVDAKGNPVDLLNRRIDAEGYLLDDQGRRVDEQGNLLDDRGERVVETFPFLDDEGQPIEDGAAAVVNVSMEQVNSQPEETAATPAA